ncbi:MAG TPA: carboxypeptidase-like regulatory domain-containing protein, partial [Puia sp.]|nr:carboxypeptidase-like regulatory domain-containing protein [Puia sp.]
MRKFTLFILTALLHFTVTAQQISGTIVDETQKPVPGVSVGLRKISVSDSSVVKYTTSDAKGKYGFDDIKPG